MGIPKLGLIILFVFTINHVLLSQFKSMDIGLFVSSIGDDYSDEEYKYDSATGVSLGQLEMAYTLAINKKLTFSPRIAYSYAISQYYKSQLRISGGNLADRTFIQKRKRSIYLKTGLALSYWVSKPGKGLFLEGEIQNLTHISSKSREMKRVNSGEIENYTLDFSDNVKGNIPSLRIGVGLNLNIKNVGFFIKISRDLRLSTYFKSTDNYTFVNRSGGFGIRYIFRHSINSIDETK